MSINGLLSTLDGSPVSYLAIAQDIEASQQMRALTPLSVGIVSTFTLDPVKPYIVVESARRGFLASTYFAPFNQLEQEVLDPTRTLYRLKPDIIVIAARLEELAPDLTSRFLTYSQERTQTEMTALVSRFENLINAARAHSSASILVFNQAEPTRLAAGIADAQLVLPQRTVIHQLNIKLAEICGNCADTFIFDYARFMTECGLHMQDSRLWYMARVPFGATTLIEMGKRMARFFRAMRRPSAKCLVLDLDNTLWGGVLGEEGPAGIKIGEDFPGRVFRDFQHYLLALRDRGVLLAIASKNNEADVIEVFKMNKDLLLSLSDFSARQIHWNDKAKSLRAIAKSLNIGTDALVFFDDQPVEREWVHSSMPEVSVVDVPVSPLGYIQALEESGLFDQLAISEEDKTRVHTFQIEQGRAALAEQSQSIEEFLQNLQITVQVDRAMSDTLPRVVQLIGKTNQFNLTARRYTGVELQQKMTGGSQIFSVRATDRLGDYGIVGAAMAIPDEKVEENGIWKLDLFLMSCRALGRQIETALLSAISRTLREAGAKVLIGEYNPTSKNSATADFYPKQGFEAMNARDHHWTWDLQKSEIPFPAWVARAQPN